MTEDEDQAALSFDDLLIKVWDAAGFIFPDDANYPGVAGLTACPLYVPRTPW